MRQAAESPVLRQAGSYAFYPGCYRDYDSRRANMEELYRNGKYADIDAELTADMVGDYLFSDPEFVRNLSVNHRNVFQRIYDEIKYLLKQATAGSDEARKLEKAKKIFEEAYRNGGKNTLKDGEVKYSLTIKHTDGSVEELADARSLTDEQALKYLQQAKSGKFKRETYIPVRKDTPQVLIDTVAQVNEKIENRSLVMQVRKAQQAMAETKGKRRSEKYGSNARMHSLTPEQIVDIVNQLDNPQMVIYQTNRHDDNGNPLPNNVAVFVEYNNGGSEGVAIIEFDCSFDSESVGTEYGDTNYHTVGTVFQPDVVRNGMEFDYAEELLKNPDNRELNIVKRQPEGSATGANQPNTSNELPFDNSIRGNGKIVNRKNSLSNQTNSGDIAPLPGNVYGKDIALETAPVRENAAVTETAGTNTQDSVSDGEIGPVSEASRRNAISDGEIGPVRKDEIIYREEPIPDRDGMDAAKQRGGTSASAVAKNTDGAYTPAEIELGPTAGYQAAETAPVRQDVQQTVEAAPVRQDAPQQAEAAPGAKK